MMDDQPIRAAHGSLVIDAYKVKVWQDGREVSLTLREFEVLLCLMVNRQRTVGRSELAAFRRWAAYRDLADNNLRSVDVVISGLRRKLGPRTIQTVRGVGYRLAAAAEGPTETEEAPSVRPPSRVV
jgi:two-component system OmpR family response regulator